jgi:N-sulfoglucosamine sulfohydrolase
MRPVEELYDLTLDAHCTQNLAGESVHEQRITALRSRMEALLKEQGDPRMFGNGKVFDDYPATSGAGFYEKFIRGEEVKAGWVEPTDFEKEPVKP